MTLPIDREPEDLLARETVDEEDETLSEDEDEEEYGRDESERKAAVALTSLVDSCAGTEPVGPYEKANSKSDAAKEFLIPLRFTKSGRKRAVPFPMKLMKVLTEKENNDIISWMPSGKAFVVRKPKLFVAQILGRVFKSAKYSSFTRKLHRWGFMRHYRGEEAGSFYHELFQKDRLDLCEQMTCHKGEVPKAKKSKPNTSSTLAAPPSAAIDRDARVFPATVPMPPELTPGTSLAGSVTSMRPHPFPSSFDLPVPSAPLPIPSVAAAADLNAAIEMEVSRRLKERINQAALSRQALLVMQQQEAKARQEQQLQYQLALLQQQQLQQQQLSLNSNVAAGLVQHLAALKFGPPTSAFKPSFIPSFSQSFAAGPMGLPPTNIQGAKTA